MKDKRAALIFEKNPHLEEIYVNPKGDYFKVQDNALASVNDNKELLKTINNPNTPKKVERVKSQTPDLSWTKDEIVQELTSQEIEFDGRKSKSDLLELFKPKAKETTEDKNDSKSQKPE